MDKALLLLLYKYSAEAEIMPNEQTRLDNLDCVYKAAYELFIENGVENTTKVMLVRKTCLSLSSVNRYFPSKLDCVVGTARWLSHNMEEPNFFSLEHVFGSTHSGYGDLESYMNQTKALFYENPKLFVFCIECRAYVFRNSKDRKRDCEAIRQAFGASRFIENIFIRGIKDGSIRGMLDPKKEAIILREAYIDFLASVALSCDRDPRDSEWLIDHFIFETLERCKADDFLPDYDT